MTDKLLGCTDNMLLFLVIGVFISLLGLILGILYLTVHSLTDSVGYTESAVPSYVTSLALILTGLMVLILFKRRNKILITLAVILSTFSVFVCLCTTVLVSLQVIPFMESFTHCVTMATIQQCHCYVIDHLPASVNSSLNIIDVGGSEHFTFSGTSSCSVITDTLIDILYTEVVIFAVGGLTCTIAMVFCVLLICGKHQSNKSNSDSTDIVSDDHVSITGSMIGTTFSRRILIPGQSYTLGQRQGDHFLRPPYGNYFQEPGEMFPFTTEMYPLAQSQFHHPNLDVLPGFGNTFMTTAQVQRSEGDSTPVQRSFADHLEEERSDVNSSQAQRSGVVDRSQVMSLVDFQHVQEQRHGDRAGNAERDFVARERDSRDESVTTNGARNSRNRGRNERNMQTRHVPTNENIRISRPHAPQPLISFPGYHQCLDDERGRSIHVRETVPGTRRGSGGRAAATSGQRQTGSSSRHQHHTSLMTESYIPAYDGGLISVYTIPGSREMFVNLRDVPSIPPAYTYSCDFAPTYVSSYTDQPPPYTPVMNTDNRQQLSSQSHGNSPNSSALPLLDSVRHMSGQSSQNTAREAPSQACAIQDVPITAIDVDHDAITTITETSNELRTLSETSDRRTHGVPVTLIDEIPTSE